MSMPISGLENSFSFKALVDQERLKLALLLNATNPRIGGVLMHGAKGTVRAEEK